MLEQILTYIAFAVSPLSVLFIVSFIYQFIKKPVDIYRAYEFSQCTKDLFDKVNQHSIEGKKIYNILKKEVPTQEVVDNLSAWKTNVSSYLKTNDTYYYNLFEDLETVDDIQYFIIGDTLNTQREIPVFGKDREIKEQILNNEYINELKRCLAVLGYIKIEIHPQTFPSVSRIQN